MRKERDYGVELLRILAMFMIVILHINCHGGILYAVPFGTKSYNLVWLGEIMCYCAVNCYALISGYVGVESRHCYSGLVVQWIRVWIYSVGVTAFCMLLYPECRSIAGIRSAIFPVASMQYWYFSAYVGMFLFAPIMNKAIRTLPRYQLQLALYGTLLYVCVLRHIFHVDFYVLGNGYSVFWLAFLYFWGGYLKQYRVLEQMKMATAIGLYVIVILLLWTIRCYVPQGVITEDALVDYLAPGIVLVSVLCLAICTKIRIGTAGKKWIGKIATLSFSVYLIHDHPLFRQCIIAGRSAAMAAASPRRIVFCVLVTAAMLFVICLLVDVPRDWLFRGLKIRERVRNLEDRLLSRVDEKKIK